MADCLKRLLGHCCGCAECPDEPWQEATALSVQGRTVITEQGAVRVRAGNVPQPGQKVLLAPTGQTAGSRPQYRDRAKRREDEPIFVPSPPAYDSPQRPGGWGGRLHLPRTALGDAVPPSGRKVFFSSDAQGKISSAPILLDDGTPFSPPSTILQVNQNQNDRAIYFLQTETIKPTGTLVDPENSIRRDLRHSVIRSLPNEYEILGTRKFATVVHHYSVRQSFSGGPQMREWIYDWEYGSEILIYRRNIPGEVQYRLVRVRRMLPSGSVQDELWLQGRLADVAIASRYISLEELNSRGGFYLYESVYYITNTYEEEGQTYTYTQTRGSEWDARTIELLSTTQRLPVEGENLPPVRDGWTDFYNAAPAVFTEEGRGDTLYSIDNNWQSEPFNSNNWGGPEFRADNDRIQAYGTSITAYGHTFKYDPADVNSSPTWTIFRDNPRNTAGGMDFSPLVVLVKQGGAIHAIRPDGSKETASAADFAKNVLRLQEGRYLDFFIEDKLSNSWPPQWGWARCTAPGVDGGYDYRAIAAHDPWRDSRKYPEAGAHPAEWDWKERPNKRPKLPPSSAPRGTLGLTLAEVASAYAPEALGPRGASPLKLPVSATVNGRDVRRAVAKRILYQPANWPEELDDRSSAGSPLVLDFGPLPTPEKNKVLATALLIRYRGKKSYVWVNGELAPMRHLGNNAAEDEGWHSYALFVKPARTYEIKHEGRISRALLCVRSIVP